MVSAYLQCDPLPGYDRQGVCGGRRSGLWGLRLLAGDRAPSVPGDSGPPAAPAKTVCLVSTPSGFAGFYPPHYPGVGTSTGGLAGSRLQRGVEDHLLSGWFALKI